MAKRGYKLQEFVAHSATVNCVNIGKKTCRHFVTGGDDYKVNLWAVGNPTSLMSLCGHTSPVESVAFDSAEVLVLAGASTGAMKLWDLEEVKMVRTFTGHRSYCTAVEFHPFGEFFASGSMDTNLKIWDTRKKGSIHTYKGHTRGISNIKFTPDGRWVVSGGLDNVVKVWDLTAGKLLHDFKFHDGHIRSIDFHPIEFLLATGSADRTVKFWDLETFELIGSTRPEAMGVRTITFHPDGRTLFCGLDDSLKVYSWEPVVCRDAVDMGWSTMGDLCIHEDKVLGCSYFQNSVGVWVADITLIEPYGSGLEPRRNGCSEQNFGYQGGQLSKETGSGFRSASCLRAPSPDYETKEIKNIYVDSTGGIPVSSAPTVEAPLDSKEITILSSEKQGIRAGKDGIYDEKTVTRKHNFPTVVPRDSPEGKDSNDSQKESLNTGINSVEFLKPAYRQKPSDTIHDIERLSVADESETVKVAGTRSDGSRFGAKGDARESSEEKQSSIKSVTEKFEKFLSTQMPPNQEKGNDLQNSVKEISSVKFVNGVAVVRGRTRSLVERFERDIFSSDENRSVSSLPDIFVTDQASPPVPKTDRAPITIPQTENASTAVRETDKVPTTVPEKDKVPTTVPEKDKVPTTVPEKDKMPITVPGADKVPPMVPETDKRLIVVPETDEATNAIAETDTAATMVSKADKVSTQTTETNKVPATIPQTKRSPARIPPVDKKPIMIYTPERRSSMNAVRARRSSIGPASDKIVTRTGATDKTSAMVLETNRRTAIQGRQPQISVKATDTANDGKMTEDGNTTEDGKMTENLLQIHDTFLSSLRSRLTKLQVVRHFWERNDVKGAINAMRKLPDHSVQADVLSGLMEKMDILTLDLFSCLLPVLVGLLDSKTERHIMISLEMLLKLGAVFAPVICSTVAAPPLVGVDLHAEQRLECCNQCFVQLRKIQNMVPELVRRGGALARSAQELNLVLQQS